MAKVYPTSPSGDSYDSSFQYDDDEESKKSESTKGYVLPTGMELMSGPIKSGGMSRTEKEIEFVIKNVKTRLETLYQDQLFETGKLKLFMIALVCSMIGLILIFYGLRMTILFDTYKEDPPNYIAVGFGAAFGLPMIYFFSFLCFPNKNQKTARRKIKRERRERKKPSLFNQMVEDAKNATEPPPRIIKVIARFRKKDYEIAGSTWKDFCEEFERRTGLPIERQLIRFKEEDLVIDLAKKMDADYGLDNYSKVFIYNKGGLFTRDAPIKKQYEELLELEHQKAEALKKAQQKYENLERRQQVISLFKQVAGDPAYQMKKPRSEENRRSSSMRQSMRPSSSLGFSSSEELGGRLTTAGMSFSHAKAPRSLVDSGGDYSEGDENSGSRRQSRSNSINA